MRFTAGMVKSDGILIMPVSVLLIQHVKLSRRLRPMRPHHAPVAEIRNFRFTQGVLLTSSDEIVDIRVPRQVRCFSCACDKSAHDQKRDAQREQPDQKVLVAILIENEINDRLRDNEIHISGDR